MPHSNLTLDEDRICHGLQPGGYSYPERLRIKDSATVEGIIPCLSWMHCNACFWHLTSTKTSTTRPGRGDRWPKMLDQTCILFTLVVAHSFACEPNVFLGLNHMDDLKSPIARLMVNYICPAHPGSPGGHYLPKALTGWSLEILFWKKASLALCTASITKWDPLLPSQLMILVLAVNSPSN